MTRVAPTTIAIAVARRRRTTARISRTGIVIVAAFVLLAIVGPLLTPYDPLGQTLLERLRPPSAEHLLGTDALGRDVLSRVLAASRIDLPLGIAAVVVDLGGALLGTLPSAHAGR